MASPGVKRPLEDEAAPRARTPEPVSNAPSSELATPNRIPGSPLSSISSTTLKIPDGILKSPSLDASGKPETPSTSQPAKRRKLTAAEKEAAKAEKERKAQEKASQQAQKDAEREAEKQKKLEDKKQKDEEREEKRRVKEAEKAARDHDKSLKDQERREKQEKRDAEKRALEDAKAKKERAQSRLTGFFVKKDTGPASPSRSRASSVGSQDESRGTPQRPSLKTTNSQIFYAFEAPSHAIVAPHNRFTRDEPASKYATKVLDDCFGASAEEIDQKAYNKRSLADAFQPPVKRARYSAPTPLKDIIVRLRGTELQPIDLTATASPNLEDPRSALRRVRVKSFYYKQDVRPPYIGTFTKTPNKCSVRRLCRQPFMEASTQLNYDYDSEAEWEEPEEGEDLGDDDGEEEEDEDGEDMEGFLDDDGAEAMKRDQLLGDMEPIFTPIHFQPSIRTPTSDIVPFGNGTLDMKQYRIETLIERPITSIDPYSTEYWEPEVKQDGSANTKAVQGAMAPPRMPLIPISGATNIPPGQALLGPQGTGTTKNTATAIKGKSGKASAPMPSELLHDFMAAIKGSTLTKVGLIEVLKSQFPSVSKGTVQDTLEQVAERVGAKASEKKWVLKAGESS